MTLYCCTVSPRNGNKTAHIVSLPSNKYIVCVFLLLSKKTFYQMQSYEFNLIPNPFIRCFKGVPDLLAVCYLNQRINVTRLCIKVTFTLVSWHLQVGNQGVSTQNKYIVMKWNLRNATPSTSSHNNSHSDCPHLVRETMLKVHRH